MTDLVNFKWPQGEDLNIQLVYKEGPDPRSAQPVNLATGYSLRMDLIIANTKAIAYTFLSSDTTLTSGQPKGQPNINIYLPRALTLSGGVLAQNMSQGITSFPYDIFLRNTTTDKQTKIMRGNITVESSNTLWL